MRSRSRKPMFIRTKQFNALNQGKRRAMDDMARHSDAVRGDVLGSYTGTPADSKDLEPVQDADDL
ncbi:MAG: hypothetical protein LBH66_02180 [Oscillospiraceae bacterium]|nr:hypothetical protein [Oscillospiraceae bacterium]